MKNHIDNSTFRQVSVIEAASQHHARLQAEWNALDQASVALHGAGPEAAAMGERLGERMDAILGEQDAICDFLAHQRPVTLREMAIMMYAAGQQLDALLNGRAEQADEGARAERGELLTRIQYAVLAALQGMGASGPEDYFHLGLPQILIGAQTHFSVTSNAQVIAEAAALARHGKVAA